MMRLFFTFIFIAVLSAIGSGEGFAGQSEKGAKTKWFKVVSPRRQASPKKAAVTAFIVCAQFKNKLPETHNLVMMPAKNNFYYAIIDDDKANDIMYMVDKISRGKVSSVFETRMKQNEKLAWEIEPAGPELQGLLLINRLTMNVDVLPKGGKVSFRIVEHDGAKLKAPSEITVPNGKVLVLSFRPDIKRRVFGASSVPIYSPLIFCKVVAREDKLKNVEAEYRSNELIKYFPVSAGFAVPGKVLDEKAIDSIRTALAALVPEWDPKGKFDLSKNKKHFIIGQSESVHKGLQSILDTYKSAGASLLVLDIRFGFYDAADIDAVKINWYKPRSPSGVKASIVPEEQARELWIAAEKSKRKTTIVERMVVLPYSEYGFLSSPRLSDLAIQLTVDPKGKTISVALEGLKSFEGRIIRKGAMVIRGLMLRNMIPPEVKIDRSLVPVLIIYARVGK